MDRTIEWQKELNNTKECTMDISKIESYNLDVIAACGNLFFIAKILFSIESCFFLNTLNNFKRIVHKKSLKYTNHLIITEGIHCSSHLHHLIHP